MILFDTAPIVAADTDARVTALELATKDVDADVRGYTRRALG